MGNINTGATVSIALKNALSTPYGKHKLPIECLEINPEAVFLLPMGNINPRASRPGRRRRRLSTPYGKHKQVLLDSRKYNMTSFYSLWET